MFGIGCFKGKIKKLFGDFLSLTVFLNFVFDENSIVNIFIEFLYVEY